MTLINVVILAITIDVILVSAEYFEVSPSITNRFRPQGYIDTGNRTRANMTLQPYSTPTPTTAPTMQFNWITGKPLNTDV